ncbi:hypothetical protein RYX36_015432 [Vicia faba]
MTNFTENNNGSSSSSPTPSVVPRDFDAFEDFYANGNWSSNNYDTAIEIDDHSSSEDEQEFDPIDRDEESRSVVKCSVCDFDINVSALQTYGSYTMICPVCEEHSSLRSRRKRAWYARKQKKYGALKVDLTLNDKKPAPRENKHEPLSPYDTPAFNEIGLDHVLISIVKCHACDFDIEVSLRCGCSEEFDANNMICPACDEKFGEDAIRTVQNSSVAITHSRAWSALNPGKKPALRENKHERMFGSDLSPSQDNLDGLSFNDFSSEEDDMSDASDVTAAKGVSIEKSFVAADAPNTGGNEGNEQDVEERSDRAAYFQELFMSALFSE